MRAAVLFMFVFAAVRCAAAEAPIALHPDNPHYFLFRGKPTVLIGSTEHYGAVLNLDFDYARYLDAVAAAGLNLTRTFSGTYMETEESFNIANNTLAPKPGRVICPWARADVPGYPRGGNKFDLTRFDPEYFKRLRDFVSQASRRGVVVEYVLFCPFYKDHQWNVSPMNASNNVNGVGGISRTKALTTDNGGLLAVQDALVRKAVAELAEFDNVYFEVCNEPYFGGVSDEWQDHVIATIVDAGKDRPRKHLIARNIANGRKKVGRPNPAVSIFNFHYATPPDTVGMNYALNKVIADDETGFKGTGDDHYRHEAWEFLLAGGAAYDNLDYSFTAAHEDGSFMPLPPKQPGGGGAALREQLRILRLFVERFDFVRMRPARELLKTPVPKGGAVQVLADGGGSYAIYLRRPAGAAVELGIDVPAGDYSSEWINTHTGAAERMERVNHPGGTLTLTPPAFDDDIALRLVAVGRQP